MANLKEVRTRISSVSSTQQITSAMKMVSAAKFRRAQNAIIGMRPYAAQLNEIIADINTGDGVMTPYHAVRPVEKVVLVVVTSIIGIFGVAAALNGYLFKHINPLMRLVLAAGGLLMLDPSVTTDLIGIVLLAGAVVFQYLTGKKAAAAA